MKYLEHLLELKKRLLFSLFFFCVLSITAYLNKDLVYFVLVRPLHISNFSGEMIYTNLTEAFLSYCKISIITGFIFSVPVFLYNIYGFVSIGLYKKERQVAKILILFAIFLFYLGCFFSYFFVIPRAWEFFLSFENSVNFGDIKSNSRNIDLILNAKMSEYVNLVASIMFAFGIAFETPVAIVLLALLNVVTIETLKKKRRLAILINFIIAGFITPPDVISQIALAIPMVFLYEIAIIILRYLRRDYDRHKLH